MYIRKGTYKAKSSVKTFVDSLRIHFCLRSRLWACSVNAEKSIQIFVIKINLVKQLSLFFVANRKYKKSAMRQKSGIRQICN